MNTGYLVGILLQLIVVSSIDLLFWSVPPFHTELHGMTPHSHIFSITGFELYIASLGSLCILTWVEKRRVILLEHESDQTVEMSVDRFFAYAGISLLFTAATIANFAHIISPHGVIDGITTIFVITVTFYAWQQSYHYTKVAGPEGKNEKYQVIKI